MAIYYTVIFSDIQSGEAFPLPVNPAELPTSRETENEDENMLGIGPVSIPRTPGLKKITLESYFPGKADGLTQAGQPFREPWFYINFFDQAMMQKKVLGLVFARAYETGEPYALADQALDVLVSGFSYTEKGGETGDFYYTLTLTEYRDYTPVRVTVSSEVTPEGKAVVTEEKSRSVPQGQIYVGAQAVVNGSYYYDSYGSEPHGSGNGQSCTVSRIVTDDPSRPYPVHINSVSGGPLGWVRESDLVIS